MSRANTNRRDAPVPDLGAGVTCGRREGGARPIMDGEDMRRALTRIAHEIIERNKGAQNVSLIGIYTRGVPMAHRLGALISQFEGCSLEVGELDIAAHRDDRPQPEDPPRTRIPFSIAGKIVVLADEVLYTGRTCRAALDALIAHGRPAEVQLAVLVDRGHRELPVRADYVGKNIPTSRRERVTVHLSEIDGEDAVIIERPIEEG